MIVSRDSGGLRVVFQVDHQDQCLLAARAWGNDTFARIDPWEPIEHAAAVHDEGWRQWEAAPEIDANGRPMDFPDLARERHVRLYEDGIAASERHGPEVGLLVSMHGLGLYRSRLGLDGSTGDIGALPAVAQEFVSAQQIRQERLWGDLGDDPERRAWAWAAYRLLQAWDALSLALTWRGLPQRRGGRLPNVPRGRDDLGIDLHLHAIDDHTAVCDPFPFAGAEALLPVATTTIPDRRYISNEDLRSALAAAPTEQRTFRILARRP